MLNRRELLRNGITVSVLNGLPIGITHSVPPVCSAAGVIDRRLTGAIEMTRRLRQSTDHLHFFSGDPGLLWMNTIEPALRTEPMRIAGFTSAPTLFCLQYLARDYGLILETQAIGVGDSVVTNEWQSGLLDLRDLPLNDPGIPLTWVLAPKRV